MKHEAGLSETRDTGALGHRMVNEQGEVIGRVDDVLHGALSTDEPWSVVRIGWLGGERFVPLHGAYVATDGNVVVPYEKGTIKHAPGARDHVLVPAVRAALADSRRRS